MLVHCIYYDTFQAELVVLCLLVMLYWNQRSEGRRWMWVSYTEIKHRLGDSESGWDTTPSPLLRWCHHIYSISAHNSAQI